MKPYVITISRQFASMGRSIATALSKDLGIEFYDRDLVEEVSRRTKLAVALISSEEETAGHVYWKRQFPLGLGLPNIQDDVFAVQKSIIQDLAKKESCVIVGRMADDILAKHPNHLSVYIYAPYEQRLANCVEKLGMDKETAKKMIAEVDAARERYYKKYAKGGYDPFAHSLMIDSSYFGVEHTAQMIADIARKRFG